MMWLVLGLLIGAGAVALAQRTRRSGTAIRWYEWLLGALGVAGLLLTLEATLGHQAENEPTAAWMSVVTLGLPSLIVLLIGAVLPWRRHRASLQPGAAAPAEDSEPVA